VYKWPGEKAGLLMLSAKIAVGGKGGVGKTTVCAVWAQLFAGEGLDVLAIDADPDTNLAQAFGIPSERSPEPIIKMKELIAERTGAGKEAVGAYFRLNPEVSDLPEKHWLDIQVVGSGDAPAGQGQGRLRLLVLGAVTRAGGGCACPEGAFLKALLTHSILQRQEVVLVDLAAGVEFMGRASVQGIDALVLVVEPGGRSIETANNMARMAIDLGIRNVGAIANKITDSAQTAVIESQLRGAKLLGSIAYKPAVQQADLRRTAVIEADPEVVAELTKAKHQLVSLFSMGVEMGD
jgi:CO dehydrogenase maturation factor